MAGKNQPPHKARLVTYVSREQARKARRLREQLREKTTRRVKVPRR